MPVRRMMPFVFVNVLISAAVVLAILYWWDGRQPQPEPAAASLTPLPTLPLSLPTPAPGQPVAATTLPPGEPGAGPETYVVQAGDTLGSISQRFQVPLADIMAANGLTNPDILGAGQTLIIPIGGLATPTPPATATSSAPPSPIPTEPLAQGEAQVVISEIIGGSQLTAEAVSIANLGSRPISLAGWQLEDEDGHLYTFAQITLFGDGAAVLVHTEAGQDTAIDLHWGLEEPIWTSGETATLRDAEGTVQATLEAP